MDMITNAMQELINHLPTISIPSPFMLMMYYTPILVGVHVFNTYFQFSTSVNWFMCFYVTANHILAAKGVRRLIEIGSWGLVAEVFVMYQICAIGITIGMHRLWSHRSFKATAPVRFVLMIIASISNQGSIYHWCRDHRVHHKCSDKDGDPHDSRRGFFYSHIGWLLLVKEDETKRVGKGLNCDDLLNDPFVALNLKLNPIWDQVWCFIVPGIYGIWRLNSFWDGLLIFGALRWIITSHATWCVNSVSHMFGDRPYTAIPPSNNLFTSIVTAGEGCHNYHHSFPYDYAAAEHGFFIQYNPSKFVIDVLALFGQTYDLKRASTDVVDRTMARDGDGRKRSTNKKTN
jgi:stearoyl-CoA desaturase (delta-9 desaturase)